MFRFVKNSSRSGRFNKHISSRTSKVTQINKQTSIVGDIEFTGFLGINGDVKGNIVSPNKGESIIVVFKDAKVDGKIKGHTVVVFGNVLGDIEAIDLTIEDGSNIVGNCSYRSIEIHRGSKVIGGLSLNGESVESERLRNLNIFDGSKRQNDTNIKQSIDSIVDGNNVAKSSS